MKWDLFTKHSDAPAPDALALKLIYSARHGPALITITDPQGRIEYVNERFTKITGYTFDEVHGQKTSLLKSGHQSREFYKALWDTLLSGAEWRGNFHNRRKNGTFYWEAASIAPVRDAQGEFLGYVKIGEDITARLETQQALEESEQRFRRISEITNDLIWDVDPEGHYLYVSPQAKELFGYEIGELLGHSMFDLMPKKQAAAARAHFLAAASQKAPIAGLVRHCADKEGREVVVETNAMPLFDAAGNLTGYNGADRNITDRIRSEETIRFMAYHDPLTRLSNRAFFNDRFRLELARAKRSKRRIALLMIDLDGFKTVNDTLGHGAGDALLRETAERLNKLLRQTDTIARMGGDEFTILLPDLERREGAQLTAERILEAVKEPYTIGTRVARVTGSIGIVFYPDDGKTAEELLKRADAAMYHAKKMGKNKALPYSPDNGPAA